MYFQELQRVPFGIYFIVVCFWSECKEYMSDIIWGRLLTSKSATFIKVNWYEILRENILTAARNFKIS